MDAAFVMMRSLLEWTEPVIAQLHDSGVNSSGRPDYLIQTRTIRDLDRTQYTIH